MLKRLVFSMLLACVLPASAQVGALPTVPHLLVKGDAVREVVPDRFEVALSISFTDVDPLAARSRVQEALDGTLKAFRESRAVRDSVIATTFSLGPDYAYEMNKRNFIGTKATRDVVGTFASAEDTKAFLSRLRTSENLQLTGMKATSSKQAEIRAELKREAMQRTRDTAKLLADAYGTSIKGLYSVSDVAPSFAYGIQAGQWPQRGRSQVSTVDTPSAMDAPAPMAGNPGSINAESLSVGTITLAEDLYAVFLLEE